MQMSFLARDTDRSALDVQIEILRAMPAWRKLELLADSCESNRALIEAGVRSRYPNASEAEIRHMVLGLTLGEETAARIRPNSRPST